MSSLFKLRPNEDSETLQNELSLLTSKAASVQRCVFEMSCCRDEVTRNWLEINTLIAVTEGLLSDMQQISEELISRKLKEAKL